MLLMIMIPANSVFHSLHQIINGESIDDQPIALPVPEIQKPIEDERIEKPKPSPKETVRGFGLGK
jgi:hypothetical protein